jgi:hypothetical protein
MGWGDEAEAYARSLIGGSDYNKELAAINKDYGQFAQEHPITVPLTEFAGGMLPVAASYLLTPATGGGSAPAAVATTARSVGALGKLAQGIRAMKAVTPPIVKTAIKSGLVGGVTGGIAGAGSAEQGEGVSGGISGGLIGGTLGTAAPLALRGVGTAAHWAGERFTPTATKMERAAAKRINEALTRSKLTAKEAGEIVNRDVANEIPVTLGNVSEPMVNLTGAAAQRAGLGEEIVAKKIGEQIYGGGATPSSRQRVYRRTKKALGDEDYANLEVMKTNRRLEADPLYEKAYEFGEVNDPKINRLLDSPQFKEYYDRAKNIAATHALSEEPGSTKYLMKEIYEVTPEGKLIRKGLPDVRTLDLIKRGLDAKINTRFLGEGMDPDEAAALVKLRNTFKKSIDKATEVNGVSDYAIARQKYAGDSEVMDAFELGKDKFGQMRRQDVETAISQMTPAEQDAFNTGVMDYIYKRVIAPSGNINAPQRILGEMADKISPLFDSPEKFKLFVAATTREGQLLANATKISGNSATMRRALANQSFEDNSGIGEALTDLVTGGPMHALGMGVMRLARQGNITDSMAGKMSEMLMSSKPEEVAAAVKILENYGTQSTKVSARLSKAGNLVAGGLGVSAQPAPSVERKPRNIEADLQALEPESKNNLPGRVIGNNEPPRRDIEAALRKLDEEEAAANETK